MIRQIFLFLVLVGNVFYSFGNPRVNELRKNLSGAPDSTKAVILVNIAKLFQYENKDSCVIYAGRASDMSRRAKQDPTLIEAETLLYQIAIEKKNYRGAIDYQKVILQAAMRIPNYDMVMDSYNALAQTWLLQNNYAEAVDVLKRGMEIARERNNLELLRNYYQALIDSYRRLGNMNAVCEYYSLLMEVNRQIDAEIFNSRIQVLQTERETLIADAEDARNWRQQKSTVSKVLNVITLIWAILVTAALLAAYFWYRYILMADVAKTQKRSYEAINELDSLRKNQESAFRFLTTYVYTNINLLAQNIKNYEAEQGKTPVAADSPLNRINNDIFALYSFFQNFTLLLQARSGQLIPVLNTVNIPQLAHNLLADYKYHAKTKKIKLVNEVQNNTYAIADERLIDTVLRNMMSNAFKYAPDGKGRITVGTKVGTKIETNEGIIDDAGYVEVWVTDDGVGLDPEQVDSIFELTENLQLPGDPDTKGYGVGLAVCKAVIELFKGRIWAETRPGEGFCIRFSLPRAKELEVRTLEVVENTQLMTIDQDALRIRIK